MLSVPENLDGANLTQGTARISPNTTTYARFLLWSLRSYRTQEAITIKSKGTTFAEITLTDLREIPVVIPREIQEQVAIATVIDESDQALRNTQVALEKLKRLKGGMIQDLFSHRVSVAPLIRNSATIDSV